MFPTVSDCCSTPNEPLFSYIMPRTNNTFNGMMVMMSIHGRHNMAEILLKVTLSTINHVYSVLDQPAELDFNSANSLK